MSEMAPEAYVPDAVTKVARNLSEIERLVVDLAEQAIHDANDREIPGGDALAALAPVASPEAWENVYEASEGLGRDVSHVADEDDTDEPPLQTLLYWSEAWRTEHGYLLDGRPTLASEANFIRWCLPWAWEHEERFDDMARDIAKARRGLEDTLYAGNRAERSRVVCPACENPPRLIKVYGGEDPADDGWKCPRCKARFDAEDFRRAHAKQLRSEGAEKFVSLRDAIGTLKAQGRPERTIRKWFGECQVEAWCDARTREVFAWWPDLWRLHLTTPTRKRKDEAA